MRELIFALLVVTTVLPEVHAKRVAPQHWRSREMLECTVLFSDFRDTSKVVPWATGVLVDYDSTADYLLLITNRHVLVNRDSLLLNFNWYETKDSIILFSQIPYTVMTKDKTVFSPSSGDSDFALIEVPRTVGGYTLRGIPRSQIIGFAALDYGQEVNFLGFPSYSDYGLSATEVKFPILRTGVVAFFANDDFFLVHSSGKRVKYMIPGMFLIDGVSYPGNSGGPVFGVRRHTPGFMGRSGVTILAERKLAGIISRHLPFSNNLRLELSKVKLLSTILDSLSASGDSVLVSQFLSDLGASVLRQKCIDIYLNW